MTFSLWLHFFYECINHGYLPLTQALLWNTRTMGSILIFSLVRPASLPLPWQSSSKALNKRQSLQTRRVIALAANLQDKTKQAKLTPIVVSHFCVHPLLNSFFSHLGSCKTWQSTRAAPGASAARSLLKLFCVKSFEGQLCWSLLP